MEEPIEVTIEVAAIFERALAGQSAQADFVVFQRRIHSLGWKAAEMHAGEHRDGSD